MKKAKLIFAAAAAALSLVGIGAVIWLAKKYMAAADFTPMVRWWVMLFVLGMCFYPLSALLFSKFSDKGYPFSKVFGILLGGWVVWVLSSLKIAKFTDGVCIAVVIVCAVLCYALTIVYCVKKKHSVAKFFGITGDSYVWSKFICYEFLFLAVFVALTYLKCFHPQAYGEEKFMDYGFMQSMMRSDYMPPEDFWFSGTNLNYYYLTQFFATFLTKLVGTSVDYGYNLSLMMTAALSFVLVYSLVSNLFGVYMRERADEAKLLKKTSIAQMPFAVSVYSRIAGALAAMGVCFSGSCHYFVYGRLVPIFREILHITGDYSYWFPDATRYIGYQREGTGDATIHEFPSYSFVQGDLHAHVVNIPFVITILTLLFAWLLWRKDRMKRAVAGEEQEINYLAEACQPHIIMMSFLIGIFHMTNYWDFPIYFVVCGAVILVSNAIVSGFRKQTFVLTAIHAAEFLGIATLTSLLFTLKFDVMAGGIGLCDKHSELYQMIVVWALPVVSVLCFLGSLILEEQTRRKERLTQTEHKNVFFAWLQNMKVSELYLLILGLCAMGLVLLPEIIYVVDIYSGDYKRANTMFKLTYQAFIMFAIVMGALIVRFLLMPKKRSHVFGGAIMLFLLVENLGYFGKACESWFGEYKKAENYKTLDASAFLEDFLLEDSKAIDWINENIEGRPVILEAPGDSYTDYNRVSAFTGCPTVIGWHTHEWLWKDDVGQVDSRVEDVKALYLCDDEELANYLIDLYHIQYIYVGRLERQKYLDEKEINYEFLKSLGEVVYEDPKEVYYETFIVKVR